MAYKIGKKCIKCHACIMNRICPEEAIIETDETCFIDAGKCTGCGACFEGQQYFCPVRAIVSLPARRGNKPLKSPANN